MYRPFHTTKAAIVVQVQIEPIKCNLAANCTRVVCRLFRLAYAISAKLTKFIGAPVQAGGVTYETPWGTGKARRGVL
jgi:hypothetical protein